MSLMSNKYWRITKYTENICDFFDMSEIKLKHYYEQTSRIFGLPTRYSHVNGGFYSHLWVFLFKL